MNKIIFILLCVFGFTVMLCERYIPKYDYFITQNDGAGKKNHNFFRIQKYTGEWEYVAYKNSTGNEVGWESSANLKDIYSFTVNK